MRSQESTKRMGIGERHSPFHRFTASPFRFFAYCLLLVVCCLPFFNGCQRESPPSQPQTPPSEAKKEAPKTEVPPVAVEMKEEKEEAANVDLKQRNPFKPYLVKMTEKSIVVEPKTPLQKYELEQLKLVAIIWGVKNPVAMIETPDGKGYSVKRGDLVGNKGGMVRRVEKNKVVVEEKFTEASGGVITHEFEIKLPLPKGEEELR